MADNHRLIFADIQHKDSIVIKYNLKYYSSIYVPQLFERIRYALKKYNIHVITKPSAKLKDLAHRDIDSIPNDESSDVHFTDKVNEKKKLNYMGMDTNKKKTRRTYCRHKVM